MSTKPESVSRRPPCFEYALECIDQPEAAALRGYIEDLENRIKLHDLPQKPTTATELEIDFCAWWKETYSFPYFGTIHISQAVRWAQHLLQKHHTPTPAPLVTQELTPNEAEPQDTSQTTAQIPNTLLKIGQQLRTQDNCGTADPIFYVQVRKRVYGVDPDRDDNQVEWKDADFDSVEIPEDADPAEPPDGVTAVYYVLRWEVVQVAFTREGCVEHLRTNGHNYQIYAGVRIYADTIYRCPEMLAIRNFLMRLPPPSNEEVEV